MLDLHLAVEAWGLILTGNRVSFDDQPQTTAHLDGDAIRSESLDAGPVPNASFTLENADITMGWYDQDWLLDPLSALDFSNFAQAGTSDSARGFNFY